MSGQLLVAAARRAGREAPAGPGRVRRRRAASCASSTSAPSAGWRSSSCPDGATACRRRSRTSPATRSTPPSTTTAFVAALRRRRTGVKRALLDQTLISGVGNIYADEALWRARLHYARPTDTLTPARRSRGCSAHVRDVMSEALAAGGTSFDALYVNVNGESGYFDRSLDAYGREGAAVPRGAAPRCGASAFMNRSSFSCPRCQPRRARALVGRGSCRRAASAATAGGTIPSAPMGVQASLRTHSEPHPPQTNTGRPSISASPRPVATLRDHVHTFWHGWISSARTPLSVPGAPFDRAPGSAVPARWLTICARRHPDG